MLKSKFGFIHGTVALTSLLASASGLMSASPAEAIVTRVGQSAFQPDAGLITFSEFAVGTQNPIYPSAQYGGGVNSPTVSFGGLFQGQSLSANPGADCPGGAVTGCVAGLPNSLLSLASNSLGASIVSDSANPTSPVLSGSPTFNGPISILFDRDIAGVGLDGGFFDAIGGTAISAYDRSGQLLGSALNQTTGIEFLGLVTGNGQNQIAGLQFSLAGAEPAGFAIDNLRFGTTGQVTAPSGGGGEKEVPEPATILGTALAGYAIYRRRKQKLAASKLPQ